MGVALEAVVRDWIEETWSLEAVLAGLDDDWRRPTPAPGWTIGHQVAHLTWTDDALALALTDPKSFAGLRARATAPGSTLVDDVAAAGAAASPANLVRRWRTGQRHTARLLRQCHPKDRIPWMGPPMGPAAAASARIMETFAHGQDVRDALGLPPDPSPRLRHVLHLAVAALPFSFANRGLKTPDAPVRVEASYEDQTWAWGPEDATNRVIGDALDLALLATRRRPRVDCNIEATGEIANAWLDIVQAYAGPPGAGREETNGSRSGQETRSTQPGLRMNR
jgi:uncharacterized protein (TIGR03084 family)